MEPFSSFFRFPSLFKAVSVLFFVLSLTPLPSHSKNHSRLQKEAKEVALISPFQAITKDQRFSVGLLFRLQPEWHTYWSYEGEVGKPFKVKWSLPEGFTLFPQPWPVPERHEDRLDKNKKIYSFVYNKEVLIRFLLKAPDTIPSGPIVIKSHIEWLICKDVCLLRENTLSLSLQVQDAPVISKETQKLFHKWKLQEPKALDLKGHFQEKGPNKLIEFHFASGQKNNVRCVDTYPLQPEDFSPAPPTLISNRNPCIFKVSSGLSQLPQIRGLLLYTDNEDEKKIRAAKFQTLKKTPFGLLWFALMAFIGGLILNIMPCVLPVIFLKLYNTLKLKEETGRAVVWLNISYAAGVIFSFLCLALFILLAKNTGESLGWGFHLQSPVFVTLLAGLFLSMGFYLLGWLALPLPKAALDFKGEKTLTHFLTGMLSTTAASPCTVPFMASAVGFALSRSHLEIFIIFLFLGLGLSFPYLLLSCFPKFLNALPAPGKWMERLKKFLALPLFATVSWLIYLLFFQLNERAFLVTLLLLSMTAVLILSRSFFRGENIKRWLLGLSLITLIGLLVFQKIGGAKTAKGGKLSFQILNPKGFSPHEILKARKKGDGIFIAFGAEWCLTCKFNERAFNHPKVAKFFKDRSIALYYGDWTNKNPLITQFLSKYGYKGVPFYIAFDGMEKTLILPGLLTSKTLLKKLDSFFKDPSR